MTSEVNTGPEDREGAFKAPAYPAVKLLQDCCSRTLEFPLQSAGALPAREQHETGPGGSADGSAGLLLYHRASIPGGVAEFAALLPSEIPSRAFMCEVHLGGK